MVGFDFSPQTNRIRVHSEADGDDPFLVVIVKLFGSQQRLIDSFHTNLN